MPEMVFRASMFPGWGAVFEGSIPDSSNDGELMGFPHSATMGCLRPWLVRSFRARERGEESRFLQGVRQCALQVCQANCYQWDARILSNFCGLREMSAPTRQVAIAGSAVPSKAIGGPTGPPPPGADAQVPAK